MTFPASGWVDFNVIQSDPISLPLPVEYTAKYADGNNGIAVYKSGADWLGNWKFIDCGVRFREGYAPPGSIPVLEVELVRPNVFGVLLVDYFDPPNEDYIAAYSPPRVERSVNNGEASPASPAFDTASGAVTPTFGAG